MIGKTILVLSPWDDPVPLTRAWCLWEILSTLRCGAELDVCMMANEAFSFSKALIADLAPIISALSKVDARRSEAWNPIDRDMILATVQAIPSLKMIRYYIIIGELDRYIHRDRRVTLSY